MKLLSSIYVNIQLLILSTILLPGKVVGQEVSESGFDSLVFQMERLTSEVDSLKSLIEPEEGPFKVTLGASFDLLRGASKTDLYSDVSFFIKELWPNEKKRWKRIGLEGAFYQTRLFGDSITSNLEQELATINGLNSDTFNVVRNSLIRYRGEIRENLGIYLSPTYKIRNDIYFVVHLEGVIKSVSTINDYVLESSDTLLIPASTYKQSNGVPSLIVPGKSLGKLPTTYQFWGGAGLMLDYSKAGINLRIKGIVGFRRDQRTPESEGVFYIINLRLFEPSLGLKLGGEVRSLLVGETNDPQYVVFIAKQFSLSRLAEFLKSK